MSEGKRKKSLVGWIRRSEWHYIKFKNQNLKEAGNFIGDKHDNSFDDDMEVRITIEEV